MIEELRTYVAPIVFFFFQSRGERPALGVVCTLGVVVAGSLTMGVAKGRLQ